MESAFEALQDVTIATSMGIQRILAWPNRGQRKVQGDRVKDLVVEVVMVGDTKMVVLSVDQEIIGRMSVLTEGLPRTKSLEGGKQAAILLKGRDVVLVQVGSKVMVEMEVFMVWE